MPVYEYKCHSCGKTFEVIRKFSDEPLTTHAECGGSVERVLSAPAFHLKGSGWYATDYAKGSGTSVPKPGDGKDGKDTKSVGSESKGDSGSSDKQTSESKSESSSSSSESKPAAPAASSESK
jgi:putative FmdB family regulatory protein